MSSGAIRSTHRIAFEPQFGLDAPASRNSGQHERNRSARERRRAIENRWEKQEMTGMGRETTGCKSGSMGGEHRQQTNKAFFSDY